MCIGVPMRVVSTDGLSAQCAIQGRTETVSLALTGPLEPDTDVLVYLGSAVRILEPGEAQQIADALKAVAAAAAGEPFDHLIADLVDREPELPAHLQTKKA